MPAGWAEMEAHLEDYHGVSLMWLALATADDARILHAQHHLSGSTIFQAEGGLAHIHNGAS